MELEVVGLADSFKRTTQTHIPEMLTVARAVITDAPSSFVPTYRRICVDVMTVCHRTKSTRSFCDVSRMVSICLELPQRALVRDKMFCPQWHH